MEVKPVRVLPINRQAIHHSKTPTHVSKGNCTTKEEDQLQIHQILLIYSHVDHILMACN